MSRIVRIESLLKQEISRIIQKDFRENLGLISITAIRISKDLANATVYYSHFGSEKEQKRSFEKLKKSASFIKGNLSKVIRLKRIPNLSFRLDDSLERGSHLINKINTNKQ
jgi:ribosome-binding factor A